MVIKGHADEWVALIEDEVVSSGKTFQHLVKQLEQKGLLHKATITRVSGNFVAL